MAAWDLPNGVPISILPETQKGYPYLTATDDQNNHVVPGGQYWKKETLPGSGVFLWVPISESDPVPSKITTHNIQSDNPIPTQLSGSYVCLSTEQKPEGQQNDTLIEYNETTGEAKVYKFISGDWREL